MTVKKTNPEEKKPLKYRRPAIWNFGYRSFFPAIGAPDEQFTSYWLRGGSYGHPDAYGIRFNLLNHPNGRVADANYSHREKITDYAVNFYFLMRYFNMLDGEDSVKRKKDLHSESRIKDRVSCFYMLSNLACSMVRNQYDPGRLHSDILQCFVIRDDNPIVRCLMYWSQNPVWEAWVKAMLYGSAPDAGEKDRAGYILSSQLFKSVLEANNAFFEQIGSAALQKMNSLQQQRLKTYEKMCAEMRAVAVEENCVGFGILLTAKPETVTSHPCWEPSSIRVRQLLDEVIRYIGEQTEVLYFACQLYFDRCLGMQLHVFVLIRLRSGLPNRKRSKKIAVKLFQLYLQHRWNELAANYLALYGEKINTTAYVPQNVFAGHEKFEFGKSYFLNMHFPYSFVSQRSFRYGRVRHKLVRPAISPFPVSTGNL